MSEAGKWCPTCHAPVKAEADWDRTSYCYDATEVDALRAELEEARAEQQRLKAGWDASEAKFDADLESGRADLEAQLSAKDAELQAAKAELVECIQARDHALEHAKRLQEEHQAALQRAEECERDLLLSRLEILRVEGERNDMSYREHEALEQVRMCHDHLDRLGAPRNQDNGLPYSLSGRLSRLIGNAVDRHWGATIRHLEARAEGAEAQRDALKALLRRSIGPLEALGDFALANALRAALADKGE